MVSTTDVRTNRLPGFQESQSSYNYSENSKSQNYIFRKYCKPRFLEALDCVAYNFVWRNDKSFSPDCNELTRKSSLQLRVGDFGCSYGHNTLEHAQLTFSSVMKAVVCRSIEDKVELQYIFSDLPGNDFNALFRSLSRMGPQLHQIHQNEEHSIKSMERMSFFAAGVPGSFYTRLLPEKTLHLSICIFGINWISQVPTQVLNRESESRDGRNTWFHGHNSPHVLKAYTTQFQEDAKSFLQCRSEELVKGGIVFIVAVCRRDEKIGESAGLFGNENNEENFNSCWQDMVDEGLVDELERDLFNVPLFTVHPRELESAAKCLKNTLELLKMEVIEDCEKMPLETCKQLISDAEAFSRWQTGNIVSMLMPLVVAHLGETRAQDLFRRFQTKAADRARTLQRGGINAIHLDIVVATFQKV